MSVIQLTAQQLKHQLAGDAKLHLLDVREPFEYNYARIDGSLHIPMNQIPDRLTEIDTENEYVVICHHGIRSQQVAMYLVQSGFSKIYNLSGGIEAWSTECDNSIPRY